jgi:tetratricopeptide (TPR) repeat protein
MDFGNFLGASGLREKSLAVADLIRERFDDSRAVLMLARIYELAGRLDESIAWALKARDMDPTYQDATWMLADLYAQIGDFDGAHFFEPDPAFNLLYWERRYDELIDLGEELVIENPNQEQVWFGLARAYAATARYDQAIFVLERQGLPQTVLVDSRRTTGIETLVVLADALKSSGQPERAEDLARWLVSYFRRVIATGGENAWWPNLYLACSLSILNDETSLQALERAAQSFGLAWYPVVRDAPCFRKYADNPRYRSVVSSLEERKAEMRERLPDTLARFQTIPWSTTQ